MRYYIILIFFNFLTSQISVSIYNEIREVPLFGLANSSMRYNNYDDSIIEYNFGEEDFETATECLMPHVLTFPAANPCYFDWTTGWSYLETDIVNYINTLDLTYDINIFSPNSQSNGNYFFEISNRDYEWWENTDASWSPINIDINDFSNFIFSNNVEGTFSLNMLTSDIETTLDMINNNSTIPFKRIELGSEYYLRGGGDKWDDNEPRNYMYDIGELITKDIDDDGQFDPGRFDFIYPTPLSFADECNIWIESLSPILDEYTKFGISSKNKPGDPRSDDWTRQVLMNLNESTHMLLDTVHLSWHEYLVFETSDDNPIALTEEQVLAFPQFRYETVLNESGMHPDIIEALETESNFNIRIWLTESAFRERGYPWGEKPWIFKWAQTLVNIQNYSLMLRNPYIDIIMLQALMGYNSTSSINHGNGFPPNMPSYNGEDSCSPYGRTASAFSIYFWNYISEGMTEMQELQFDNSNDQNTGFISLDPADNNLSPDINSSYSYLLGWKLFNHDQSTQRALIINISDEDKTLIFDNSSVFTNNIKSISIMSINPETNFPSIDQYINGDSDLTYDTTFVNFSDNINQLVNLPAYSITLFKDFEGDLNNDNFTNVIDIIQLVNIILEIENPIDNADLNYDGIINVIDIIELVNIIIN